MYRPKEPFTTPAELWNPTTVNSMGVTRKTYSKVDDINVLFRTFGGTDTTSNDQLVVLDTANVETWYRPDIRSDSQIRVGGKLYEVKGDPEDIELRHQYMKIRLQAVKGGV